MLRFKTKAQGKTFLIQISNQGAFGINEGGDERPLSFWGRDSKTNIQFSHGLGYGVVKAKTGKI